MKLLIVCLLILHGTTAGNDILEHLDTEIFLQEMLDEVDLELEGKDFIHLNKETGELEFEGPLKEFLDSIIPEVCHVTPGNCSLLNTYYLDCNCFDLFSRMGTKCSNTPCKILKKVRDDGPKLLNTVFISKNIAELVQNVGKTLQSFLEEDMCSCGVDFFKALMGCAKFYDANILYDFVECDVASGYLRLLRNLDLTSLGKFLGRITKYMCAKSGNGKCYDEISSSLVTVGEMVDNTLRGIRKNEDFEKNYKLQNSCDYFYRLVEKTEAPRLELNFPRRIEAGSDATVSCNLYHKEFDQSLELRVKGKRVSSDMHNETNWSYVDTKRWEESDKMTTIEANKDFNNYDNGTVVDCTSYSYNLYLKQTLEVYSESDGIVENDQARLELSIQDTDTMEEGASPTISCSVTADKLDKSLKLLVNGTSAFSKHYSNWWGRTGYIDRESYEKDNGRIYTIIDTNRDYMLSDDGTTFTCVSTKYNLRKERKINVYSTKSKSRSGKDDFQLIILNTDHAGEEDDVVKTVMRGLAGLMNKVYCDKTCSDNIAKTLYPCCYKAMMSDKRMFDYLEKFVVSLVKNYMIGTEYNFKDYMQYNRDAHNYANYTLPAEFRKMFMEIVHPAAYCSAKKKKNPKCTA